MASTKTRQGIMQHDVSNTVTTTKGEVMPCETLDRQALVHPEDHPTSLYQYQAKHQSRSSQLTKRCSHRCRALPRSRRGSRHRTGTGSRRVAGIPAAALTRVTCKSISCCLVVQNQQTHIMARRNTSAGKCWESPADDSIRHIGAHCPPRFV